MSDATPVQPGERIPALDIIRGFALLGIFIMNMPGLNTSPFAGADGSHLFNDWWDRGTEQLRTLLFDGKFNSMFSFLFAVGFTIQMARLRERDPAHANAIYLRRLSVLLALGLVHAFVFWYGDVLHIYAVLGLLLIFGFSRLSDRSIIMLMAIFLSASTVYWSIRAPALDAAYFAEQIATARVWEASTNHAFGQGSFTDAVRENFRVMVFSYTDPDGLRGMLFFYFQMCTTMLLGLLAGRHHWIQNASAQLPAIRRILKWAIGTGLALGAVAVVSRELRDPLSVSVLDIFGGVAYKGARLALIVSYICAILLLIRSPAWLRRFAPLAIAGRMPLTNYLLQTAMGLSIFYGWGLGLWGRAGPLASLVLAVALFFLVQVPLSRRWLERYRYGPMEWLWRVLTYGRSATRTDAGAAPA